MTINIEMVSDIVCPWCWVGLRRLKGALEMTSEIETAVHFRPFELDPTIPAEGTDYKTYMAAKFGTGDSAATNRWQAMRDMLVKIGAEEDIPFDFDGISWRPNTMKAHRLVHWAQGQGKGMAAKEALFTAFFRDHRNIGDADTLADIGGEIGLDRAMVADLLAGEADHDAVKAEEEAFVQMGVQSVPTFIADRKWALQGAESSEKIADMIRTIAANAGATHGEATAEG